jgi:hypothetical protein
MTPAINNVVSIQEATCCTDLKSIVGVQIGRDKTNNFVASFNGLAVRTWDGRYVVPTLDANHETQLLDVTCLTLPIDPFAFRVPVSVVHPGDLIVTSDSPFSVLFVETASEGSPPSNHIRGLVPGRKEVVEYVPPKNVFNFTVFVKVFSIFDFFSLTGSPPSTIFGGGGNLLPFLLLCLCKGDKTKSDSFLPALLASQAFGTVGGTGTVGGFGTNLLPLLLLSDCGDNSGLETLLLFQGLAGGTFPGLGFGH